jgi:transketolase C-terminal domain/subunit
MAKDRVLAAVRALEKAKSEHTAARAEYEAQFSLLQRACKHLGARASAYRAEHVTPKEENLKRARADLDDASAAAATDAEAAADSAEATTAADAATDAAYVTASPKTKDPHGPYLGAGAFGSCRNEFGDAVEQVLGRLKSAEERRAKVVVIDGDLGGSSGLKKIREKCPEVYIKSGSLGVANACEGFDFANDSRQGVFATFAAFQEQLISDVTMAQLNHSNVLCHFSHSGVDDMTNKQCHFGINNFFADCGLEDEDGPKSQLFFPADVIQMNKVVERVFWEKGLRFVYSSRFKVPELLDESGMPYYGEGYTFEMGRDDFLAGADEDCDGYIVSYGDALYQCLDAVRRLREQGLSVGLVNKCHANVVDEKALQKIGNSRFVLCVESQSTKTGLGIRFGTWLLERKLSPVYARIGTHRPSPWPIPREHAYHQGYDSESIMAKVKEIAEVSPCKGMHGESEGAKVKEIAELSPCKGLHGESEGGSRTFDQVLGA